VNGLRINIVNKIVILTKKGVKIMDNHDLLYSIKTKEQKTDTEKLLLHYRRILTLISCVLVDESKEHFSKQIAIDKIRMYIREMDEPLDEL
jgi:hypothetical protein